MAYIDFAYLCELAQFGRIGLALLSVRDSDHGLDLILATFYSLLGFRSRWRNSLNQDSGQAIAKCFKIGLFLRGYHQQGARRRYPNAMAMQTMSQTDPQTSKISCALSVRSRCELNQNVDPSSSESLGEIWRSLQARPFMASLNCDVSNAHASIIITTNAICRGHVWW
jgi:hypothetical protein